VRWSTKTDELVRAVAQHCRPGLQSELGGWLEERSRFRDFVATNQDKVRKKLSGSRDEDSRLDVRSELLVAYLVLADRRFEVAFEAYGAGRRGPDLTVTYRANQRFNLEVTRLRTAGSQEGEGSSSAVSRLANLITAKVRQLPGDLPNALVITTRGLPVNEETLADATRLLKLHTDGKDDVFFERRGLRNARDFYAQYLHLSGVLVLDEAGPRTSAVFFANREARRPLPSEAVARLTASLNAATTTG
jgi:hypothetical protein